MKKILLCSLFLFTSYCAATIENQLELEDYLLINKLNTEDETDTRGPEAPIPDIVCISLGARCSAALNFRRNQLSMAYYPFDFIATPLTGLHILLKTKFKDFLTKSALKIARDNNAWLDNNTGPDQPRKVSSQKMVVAKNSITGCEFIHDFATKRLEEYKAVAAKYQRRINRFYKTINHAKYIYFFRTHLNKKEATALHSLLKKLFSKTRFVLVAPTDPEHMQQPWNLPGVKEFLMYPDTPGSHNKVHGNTASWDHIFHQLKLI